MKSVDAARPEAKSSSKPRKSRAKKEPRGKQKVIGFNGPGAGRLEVPLQLATQLQVPENHMFLKIS